MASSPRDMSTEAIKADIHHYASLVKYRQPQLPQDRDVIRRLIELSQELLNRTS